MRKGPNYHALKRPPQICDCGLYAWTRLTKGFVTFVDAADIKVLEQNWYASISAKRPDKVHACRATTKNGRKFTLLLSREIMNAPDGVEVDHKNRDRLDHQRKNLRIASRAQNQMNKGRRKSAKNPYKGVYKISERGYYVVVGAHGVTHRVNGFTSLEAAVRARNDLAKRVHGSFYSEPAK